MTLAAPPRTPAALVTGVPRRLLRSTTTHVVLLAAVLTVLWATGPRGHGFTDDGIALSAQVEALAEGSWTVPHPYPEVDPDLRHYPDRMASPAAGGDGYAPYPKHPLVPMLLIPGWRLAGDAGIELVVLAGLVAAALAVSRVVAVAAPSAARVAFWLVGVGSVMVVHGFVLWLHAWALAAAAAAVGAALRLLDPSRRPSWRSLLGLAVALALTMLLRTEGVLLAGSIAAGLLCTGLRRGRRGLLGCAAVAVFVAAVVVVLEGAAQDALIGPLVGLPPQTSGGWLADRLSGSILVFALGGLAVPTAVARLVAVLLLVGVVHLARSGTTGAELRAVTAVATGAYVWSVLWLDPSPIPGFVPALPVLVVPLLLPRASRRDWFTMPLLVIAGTYVALLAVTVYPGGGGGDWGGRYVVVAVAALAPLAAHRLVEPGAAVRRADARVVALGLVVATVAAGLPVHSELRARAETAGEARSAILAGAAELVHAPATGHPVVVVGDGHVARLLSLDQDRLTPLRVVHTTEVAMLVARLSADGVTEVLVVDRSPVELPPAAALPAGWHSEPARPLTGTLDGVTLRSG